MKPSPFYAICDLCSEGVALVSPGTTKAVCAACRAYEYNEKAAAEQLREVAANLGAWTAAWSSAGLSLESLSNIIEDVSYVGRFSLGQPGLLQAILRKLRMEHPLPSIEELETPPQRLRVDLYALPLLTEFLPQNPEAKTTRPLPIFKDASGETYRPPTGLSTVSFDLGGGTQAFLFADNQGRLTADLICGPAGYRVARALVPAFEHYLQGPDYWDSLPNHFTSK